MQNNITENNQIFLGRLGKDPEFSYVKTKNVGEKPIPVCNLAVAINFKDGHEQKTQ